MERQAINSLGLSLMISASHSTVAPTRVNPSAPISEAKRYVSFTLIRCDPEDIEVRAGIIQLAIVSLLFRTVGKALPGHFVDRRFTGHLPSWPGDNYLVVDEP